MNAVNRAWRDFPMVGERELGMGGIRARSEGQSSSYREGVLGF